MTRNFLNNCIALIVLLYLPLELKMTNFKLKDITYSLRQQGEKRQSMVIFQLAACSIICIVLKLIAMGTNNWIIFAGSKGTNNVISTIKFILKSVHAWI